MSGRDDELREARIRTDVLRRERYHDQTTQRIFEAVVSGQRSRGGRPKGSGTYTSLEPIIAAMHGVLDSGGRLTQERAAGRLNIAPSTLRGTLNQLGTSWMPLREKVLKNRG